ncbi:helix-turn-helix domain-containing protein [Actinoplanes sp. NPDC051859]|uniref:helix-turn-helix domain-containing protein n=1 Tax=Actinoplanes sp. NPDC051859 TaxID=3363909 RepID=UPI003787A36A
MTQDDWSARLTSAFARNIRRRRNGRGLSAQQLADACAGIGHAIPRSVLANLESGRREVVNLAEVLVLAEVLEVSPVELMIPLGDVADFEVLPGRTVPATAAMQWIRGEAPLPGSTWDGGSDGSSVVASYLVHQQTIDRWHWNRAYAELIRKGEREGTETDAQRHDQEAERARSELVGLRRLMKLRELSLPEPPPLMALPGA